MAATLPLIIGKDNPILRKKSQPVETIDKTVKKLIEKMKATARQEKGIGIAAPQVGENIRVLIAQISGTFVVMINPEILEFSDIEDSAEEGCLSLPGEWGIVRRPIAIKVRFTDEKNAEHILHLKDIDARVVQHEVDHLDGILFPDRVEQQQRVMM